jgi:hypothetical protein
MPMNMPTGITHCDHDQRVDFYHGGKTGIAKEGLFHFWFNTRMLHLDDTGYVMSCHVSHSLISSFLLQGPTRS